MSDEIGFFGKTFRTINDVLTLGRSAELRDVKAKIEFQAKIYSELMAQIVSLETLVKDRLGEIGRWIRSAMKLLSEAEELLRPMEQCSERQGSINSVAMPSSTYLNIRSMSADYESFVHVATGAGAGAAAAAGVWGAVQIVGHASTGAAMLGLHGAAASSAGWAWLGGGSLAAGGGGMALGHLVLPGIGSVVAVAFGTFLTHKEVVRCKLDLDKVWEANKTNRSALAQLNIAKGDYDAGLNRIESNTMRLRAAVKQAKREVMRFGFLSRIWKLLRQLCGLTYYTPRELYALRHLEDAVARFLESMKEKSSRGSTNWGRG